jgi:hypothetical protein
MLRPSHVFAATLLGLTALTQPAAAQDFNTATVNGTTIWVGGGVQFLSLPDINFTAKNTGVGVRRTTNSEGDWLDFGGAAGGGIETSLGIWGNSRVTGAVKGFWAEVETDERTNCSGSGPFCVVIDPAGELPTAFGSYLATFTDREATYWGGQAELKFGRLDPIDVKPDVYRNDYFIVGFDVRGIDQDNKLHGIAGSGAPVFTYKETLDTTYTGGYIGIGGEYSFGFIPGIKNVGGLYDRLGLRTFASARVGLYNAETDYDGSFAYLFIPGNSRVSQSDDELAFIGSVSLETRKQIGARTSISLWTDYEYISSVPKLEYASGPGSTTRLDDEALFASRTMLRLNIGLGSSNLYPAQ